MSRFTITRDGSSALKAVAIIMVITDHIGQAFGIGIVNPLGPVGVFLFLFLSGYGLSCSYEKNGRKRYFPKKLIKVYLPYVLTVMLFLLGCLCLRGELPDPAKAGRYLLLLTLPQGSFWYLRLLFYWYVVFYLLTFVYDKRRLLVPMLCAAALLIILIKRDEHVYIWNFLSFPLGVLAAKFPELIAKLTAKTDIRIIAAVLFMLAAAFAVIKKLPFVEKSGSELADNALQTGLTLSAGLLLITARKALIRFSALRAVLLTVGSVSYESYLSHAVILDHLYDNHDLTSLGVYILGTAVSLAVLILFDRLLRGKKEVSAAPTE